MKATLFFVVVALLVGSEAWFSALRTQDGNSFKIVSGKVSSAVAWAKYTNNMTTNGWTDLTVESNGNYDDQTQAFAAGFIEGYITYKEIHDLYVNYKSVKGGLNATVQNFPVINLNWMNTNVKNNPSDAFWVQVGLTLKQSEGMRTAYNQRTSVEWRLDSYEWNNMQLACELGDINTTASFKSPTMEDEHCSSLVRLTPDGRELFAAHNTWSSFSWMLRTWKSIKLNFKHSSTKSKTISYAGYPGTIPSGDDFYVTDQKLMIMETTNSVYNKSLFRHVTTATVPYWIRVTVANRMSASGKEWNDNFGKYNSGTYNNQWIVVDTKQFTPGQPLREGTLWISEQIPGLLYAEDKTEHLAKHGFWASYNVPYFPYIYNISGLPEHVRINGNGSSYEWCPRAQIFRREAPKVNNLQDMKHIMRFNQYQSDPLSLGDACSSIAARCDLNNHGSPFGALDAKISSASMMKTLSSEVVSGPSWDFQPPFAWTERWSNYSSLGMPRVYAFPWVKKSPSFN